MQFQVFLLYGTMYFCRKDGIDFWQEPVHNLIEEIIPKDALKMEKDQYYFLVDWFSKQSLEINKNLFHYKYVE